MKDGNFLVLLHSGIYRSPFAIWKTGRGESGDLCQLLRFAQPVLSSAARDELVPYVCLQGFIFEFCHGFCSLSSFLWCCPYCTSNQDARLLMLSTVRMSAGGKWAAQRGSEKSKLHQRNICDSHCFFFPTPGVWLGCVSCASSKQLISVDLHWFALRLHQPPSPTFNAVWRTGLVSTNRSSLKGAKPKFWQDGCDDRVASVHLLPSGHISANFPIVHFPNLSFQQKQRLWGSHGEFTVRTRVLGVCFFCCALSAMIDMTPCQVASCYHC